MQQICRACLSEITDLNFAPLSSDTKFLQIKAELSFCVPEMDLDLVKDPVLCANCVSALHSAYIFKNQCLRSDERIRNRIKGKHLEGNFVCLTEIFKNSNVENLEPPTRDIVDELNSLLDDALGITQNPYRIFSVKEKVKEKEVRTIIKQIGLNEKSRNEEGSDIQRELSCPVKIDDDGQNNSQHNITNNQSSTILQRNNQNFQNCYVKLARLPNDTRHFKNQIKINTKVEHFTCNFCNYSTAIKGRLNFHMKIHTGEKPFTCNICQFRTAYKLSLKIHMRVHTGEKPYVCKICNYTTSGCSNLVRHMKKHHAGKLHACKMCKFQTSNKTVLREHMRIQVGQKHYKCDICQYNTSMKGALTRHKLRHSGEKPFICNICQFRTAHKYYLTMHMGMHTGEKPFKCKICDYQASYKSNVMRHMRNHEDKPLICHICQFRTGHKKILIRHLKTHIRT